jgi:hypothetical protein
MKADVPTSLLTELGNNQVKFTKPTGVGTVITVHDNNTVDVQYENGVILREVPTDWLEKK